MEKLCKMPSHQGLSPGFSQFFCFSPSFPLPFFSSPPPLLLSSLSLSLWFSKFWKNSRGSSFLNISITLLRKHGVNVSKSFSGDNTGLAWCSEYFPVCLLGEGDWVCCMHLGWVHKRTACFNKQLPWHKLRPLIGTDRGAKIKSDFQLTSKLQTDWVFQRAL